MSTEDTPKPDDCAALPSLPVPIVKGDYTAGDMRAYARAAVAKERERLRALVEVVRDANCDAEDVNTFRLLKPGQERAWLALMAGLNG